MPTELQRRAVNEMVENGGKVNPAMIKAGYSKATANTPKKLTESKGFKEICEECGLTDNLILESLTEDIKKKPQNRKPELELGAKIKGMLVDKQEFKGELDINEYVWEESNNSISTETLDNEVPQQFGEMESPGNPQAGGENNSNS